MDIRIVAVSKGAAPATVAAAFAVGIGRFGENRVQEAETKVQAAPDAEWHFVGTLQSNKVRRAVSAFDWIEAIDSLSLLDRLDRAAHDAGRRPRVLLQVNLTGAASQHGFDATDLSAADGLRAVRDACGRLTAASVEGLMGIGPMTTDFQESRRAFAGLRDLRDRIADATDLPMPELSMGMSADFEAAVAEGATLVRLGTAIFGERPARI